MPDELDRDEGVPFDLPDANNDKSIHTDDTDEIEIPEDIPSKQESTDDVLMSNPEGEETVPHQMDDDVPFDLPATHDLPADKTGPIGHKWVTLPNPATPKTHHTLYSSGGLDPNPDFSGGATVHVGTVRHNPLVKTQQPAPPPTMAPSAPVGPSKSLPKRRRRQGNVGCLAMFIGLTLTFCGGFTLLSLIGGGYAYARVGELLNERIDEVDRYSQFQSTFLYDRSGKPLYEVFNEGRRTAVNLAQVPQYLIDATIAIEDDSFYDNIGIDVGATTVALLKFIGADPGEKTPGGSTITQQLVRNVLFDPEYAAERTPQRKAEEILLALALNSRKNKNEILELYLNEIYYGNLAYGAQAASNVFFNKDVNELTLGEAALLAGLPQIPAELDPLNPDPSIQAAVDRRWRQVLQEMVEEKYISDAERNQALSDGLTYTPQDVPLEAPHFTVYAQSQFEQLMLDLGYEVEEIAAGGFHVYTTVDLNLNNITQQIAAAQIVDYGSHHNISNAAVIILKPLTGEIMAMVGSIDYFKDAIDGRVNVTTAFRQPGSTMKPFTYAGALERGFSTGDVIWDTRVSIGIPGQQAYVPRNYDGAFHGPMRMRTALANSYNIPAVQTLRSIGVDYLLQLMARFGVDSLGTDASRYGLSLTLGGGEISPLELTRAYSVFANQGVLVDTTAILCVMDNDNNIIYQYEGGCPSKGTINETSAIRAGLGTQVLDPRVAYIIGNMLSDNNARTPAMGSNSALYTPGIISSVKTGTTDDIKDNWTVGFTSNVAIGVWVGNNNGDPMVNSSGLTGAAPIWNETLNTIYSKDHLLRQFAVDNRLLNDEPPNPGGISLRNWCNVQRMTDPANGCNGGPYREWALDSPAAVPNANGEMIYPQQPIEVDGPPPSSGSYVVTVEPGIYRTIAYRIPDAIAAGIQFHVSAGQRQPPPPRYCRVPLELAASPGVQDLWFITPPLGTDQNSVVEAEEYAHSHNLPILPSIECTPDLLQAQPALAAGYTAYITAPQPNATVTEEMPIIGTAQFPQTGETYYRVQILGGQWNNWTTLGTTHPVPVVNGPLETLAPLPSGTYQIRLEIIANGNSAMTPYIVPFIVP